MREGEGEEDIGVPFSPPQANIRAQQRASFKKITEQVKKKKPLEKKEEDSLYFDPRVKQQIDQKGRKVFKFNEPG